jgi:alpha-glucosidase (family GH31 glycosyl hydrolase)
LPAGDWVDLWRSVEVAEDGALRPHRAKVLKGGRQYTLPAPLKEIPILVRAGASLRGIPLD